MRVRERERESRRVRERVGELERERVRQRRSLLTNYVKLCLVFVKPMTVPGESALCHSKSFEHS